MPEVEKALALQNMKQWVCCIIQLCDSTGDPFTGALFPSLFLNSIPTVTQWICTGEHNNDGIFHCHAMMKTTARSDSVNRSMRTAFENMAFSENITRRFGKDPQFECMKIQKCHKPESMLKYIMKGPEWVASNSEQLLQLAYDIDMWNLNEKYKKQVDPPLDTVQMNPMVKDLLDVITMGSCKTLDDCLRTDPVTMAKYLHRPGLPQILTNCLAYAKATGGAWNISNFSKYPPKPDLIHAVLLHQGLTPSATDLIFWQWINKLDSKRNTICIHGPSNTGKSAFISGLKACVPWGECVNGNNFNFQGLIDQVIGIWEEPLINPETAEKCKQLFEGMLTSIPVKYKPPALLPRIPLILTTNHWPWRFCNAEEDAFRNRMFILPFVHQCKDVPLTYRTSEYSCECCYCATSRGCPPSHGGTVVGDMPRANQPLFAGEHGTIGTYPGSDVGTRSLYGTGEGTSRCHHSESAGAGSSTDPECSYSSESQSSTSTTIVGNIRHGDSDRSGDSGNRGNSSLTISDERLVTEHDSTSHGHDSGPDGSGQPRKHKFKRRHVTTGDDLLQPSGSTIMGLRQADIQEETLQIPSKQPRMDRMVDTLTIPSKSDWQSYLSFLLSRYG